MDRDRQRDERDDVEREHRADATWRASRPLTTGLTASPISDAVVSSPKPVPRTLAGMTAAAAV